MPIRSIADIEAMEALPLADRGLPRTTYEALAATAQRTPDAKALSFFLASDTYDHVFTWSYAELLADVTRAANAFHAFGVSADHPVAFVLPNLPETHFTIWGGEAAGVVFAINHLLDPSQIAELLRAARVRVLVTLGPAPGIDLWTRLAPHLQMLPNLRIVAWVDLSRYAGGAVSLSRDEEPDLAEFGFDIVDFRRALQEQPSDRLVAPQRISPSSTSSYVCTGGTTGLPKIAVRTHGNEVFDAWSTAQILGPRAAPRTFFCGLPLFHSNAQIVTGLLPWMRGDHVVLGTPEGYRSKGVMTRFWEIAAQFRVSMFSGVPTIYAALLDLPIGDNDISSLELALCGAAPMPARLIESFEAKTAIKILEGYGLTEGTCVSSVNLPEGERRPGSIGMRIPYQQMRAVILDDAGHFLRMAETHEIGTLAIRGPNVFSGYLDDRHNRDVWIDIDGELWLNTGDLGREDEEGRFWLSGRRKELIIRGGHNIDPKLIEDALLKHPAVALAAAIGSPDAYAGEVPVAYVQTQPGATVTDRELLDFAAASIPERAAVPKQVNIVPALPMTGVGKIFKPALQQLEVEAVVRAEALKTGTTIADIEHVRNAQGVPVIRVRTEAGATTLQAELDRYALQSEVLEGPSGPDAGEETKS
ncbi:acyl-CoA synthetase [Microvirga sp. KLBC 81]|uniref:acyl-CoA synthetase n=1 Tax=Microvirga sp. KLBC 81 TaxID=1862707 RepID=UPI000D507D53|nr:acyl-CoA synthetase [Microvirga sp. KLBC 81]PVE21692.1 acyl-CoA synthetase [Microvirga sp. KLBC 81]